MSLAPEVRRGGGLPFGQIVSQWVCDDRYTTNLRTLYGILVTYADIGARDTKKGKPYRTELARQLGVSLKTLDRTSFEGECAGLFRVEERKDPNNPTVNDANIYHLNDALFWQGEWVDPLRPGEKAAAVAQRLTDERVAAKKAAGYVHKGGRKKQAETSSQHTPEEGVASPMTPPREEGGSVTHDATPSVTHDATLASPMTPNVYNPVENPPQEPTATPPVPPSVSDPSARASDDGRPDGRTDGGEVDQQNREQSGEPGAGGRSTAPAAPVASEGVALLIEAARRYERAALPGELLHQLGRHVEGLLAGGWSWSQLMPQITAPLPPREEVKKTDSALTAARIRKIPGRPPAIPAPGERPSKPDVPGVPSQGAVRREPRHCCVDCGAPGVSTKGALCRKCQERCPGGCGQAYNHIRPDGLCPSCATGPARPEPTPASPEPQPEPTPEEVCAALFGTHGATRPGGCAEGVNGCQRDAVREDRCEVCHEGWTAYQAKLDEYAPAYAGQQDTQAPF
ncbi:hypothetical protein [Kitasatospora sp. NPDC008115]|uniref:hypothetical protein n=1 Tax=Kitasatospora sp. NPDC008115 TaxID=3364022 RepID=UPI0036E7F2AA